MLIFYINHTTIKTIQQNVSDYLYRASSEAQLVSKHCHGFIQGRSIVSNAKMHLKKECVVRLDFKNFFQSIRVSKMDEVFQRFDNSLQLFYYDVVRKICFLNNHLPTGAPSSPILSNIYCSVLDDYISLLAKEHDLIYTRYVDDLIFSGDKDNIEAFFWNNAYNLTCLCEQHNLRFNHDKTRTFECTSRQIVTGIKVNEKPKLPEAFLKNIRAMLHDARTNGIDVAANNYVNRKKSGKRKGDSSIASHFYLPTYDINPLSSERVALHRRFQLGLRGKIMHIRHVMGATNFYYQKYQRQFDEIFGENIV